MANAREALKIGPSTQVRGDVAGEGDIAVEGLLAGSLRTSGQLWVAPGGTLEAAASVGSAVLAGRLSGQLTVADHLEVHEGAELAGEVQAETVSLEAGARVDSQFDMPLTLPETRH